MKQRPTSLDLPESAPLLRFVDQLHRDKESTFPAGRDGTAWRWLYRDLPGEVEYIIVRGKRAIWRHRVASRSVAFEATLAETCRWLSYPAMPRLGPKQRKGMIERLTPDLGRAAATRACDEQEATLRRSYAAVQPVMDAHPDGCGHCTVVHKQVAKNLGGGIETVIRRVEDKADVFATREPVVDLIAVVAAKYLSGGKNAPSDPPVGEWQPRKAGRNG